MALVLGSILLHHLFFMRNDKSKAQWEKLLRRREHTGQPLPHLPRKVSFPHNRVRLTRKRQADTEAYIAARLGELGQIGTQETVLGQFTPSPLNALSIEQAVKIEENRAIRIRVFVATAKKRKAELRVRITAMLRKNLSESQKKQLMLCPAAGRALGGEEEDEGSITRRCA